MKFPVLSHKAPEASSGAAPLFLEILFQAGDTEWVLVPHSSIIHFKLCFRRVTDLIGLEFSDKTLTLSGEDSVNPGV